MGPKPKPFVPASFVVNDSNRRLNIRSNEIDTDPVTEEDRRNGGVQGAYEDDWDDNDSLKVMWKERKRIMKGQIKNNDWEIRNVGRYKRIVSPTASKMDYLLMNPNIYHRIEEVVDLNHFAEMVHSPADWETVYNSLPQQVHDAFKTFKNLPFETPESNVESLFLGLVSKIELWVSLTRGIQEVIQEKTTKAVVGGFLALHEYDVRSLTDARFVNKNGTVFLATEVKSASTFDDSDLYYRGSRGIQTFTALYASNAPTLLLSPRYFKLFVENDDRTQIFTYPYGVNINIEDEVTNYHHSTATARMNEDLLKIIIIALLAKRPNELEVLEETVPVEETVAEDLNDREKQYSPKKPRRSARVANKTEKTVTPTFSCGVDNFGNPIRAAVRVLSEEEIEEFEALIAADGIENLNQQPSLNLHQL
jgi:hypothetical protein